LSVLSKGSRLSMIRQRRWDRSVLLESVSASDAHPGRLKAACIRRLIAMILRPSLYARFLLPFKLGNAPGRRNTKILLKCNIVELTVRLH
jgi:hypothetical protein